MNTNTNEITLELNLDLAKIKEIINRCIDLYYESLNYKRSGNFDSAYYNLLLSLNLLQIIEQSIIFKNIKNHEIKKLLASTINKIDNSIIETKEELNSYYTDHLNQLINTDVKKKIDSLIIQPLKLQSLYSINNKNILVCSDDLYSKKFLINYIKKNIQSLADISIIHQSFKLDFNYNSKSKKILVIIDDIDKLDSKTLDNIKKINNENVYLICTCCFNINILPSYLTNLFTEIIYLDAPDLRDINNFIRYKIYNYLDYKDIFQSKYNIPILENKNLEFISQVLYNSKKNYLDTDKIINNFFDISSKSCLQQNIFFPLRLEDANNNYFLLSKNSIKKKNISEKFLYKIPKYKEINYDNQSYINICYTDNINFSYEDNFIQEVFIDKEEYNNNTNKQNIQVIALAYLNINNETKDEDFDCEYELSKLILKLYIHYLNHILVNINNKHSEYKDNSKITKLLNLISTKNIEILNIDNLYNYQISELKDILTLLDSFLFETKQKDHLSETLNKYSNKNYYTYFLYIENLETKIYLSNNEHIEHLILSKDIDIAKEIRSIIKKLFNFDVSIEIIKNVDYYVLNVQADDNNNLSNLKIFLNDQKLNSLDSIIIGNEIFNFSENYCFTNEKDINLLVDKFPKDYSHIYSEDEETWKYVPIKKEHLDYLNNEYDLRSKFYLYIYNFILLYQKYNESILSQLQISKLEKSILDFQMIIDCILFNTSEFETEENISNENPDKNKDFSLVWNKLWNTSYMDKEDENDDENEFTYQKKISRLHKKFYIDQFFLKRFIDIFRNQNINSIYDYYLIYRNKIESKTNYQELFIKGTINLQLNQNNLYRNYYINNPIKTNKVLIENIISKLSNKNSFYFNLFENIDCIFIKFNNHINTYKISQNESLNFLKQIGFNIIKKENQMSLFKLDKGNNKPSMMKWIISFIISSILSYTGKYNFNNLFISCLLYKDYYSNNKDTNIADLINNECYIQQIINKINYFYSLNQKDYIINDQNLFEKEKHNINLKYSTHEDFKNNIQLLSKLNLPENNYDIYIRNFNLKKEYFEDSLFEYDLN